MAFVTWFEECRRGDLAQVGGKNASLGELIGELQPMGVAVPGGFAVTVAAYQRFIADNGLQEQIDALLAERAAGGELQKVGAALRALFTDSPWPADIEAAIRESYAQLCARTGVSELDVAVRSSATAEDLPDASFAGQQATYLGVVGADGVLDATRECFASLFTDRAISYREQKKFAHDKVFLSVGVQQMVRSDLAAAGTMFTLDTETGFPDVVVIDASWGLGESVVGGIVTPDEYRVFKPLLDVEGVTPVIDQRLGRKETRLVYGEPGKTVREDTPVEDQDRYVLTTDQAMQLARWAVLIEKHYGCPMDIEWALDGRTQQLFITQARPETVHSTQVGEQLETWTLTGEGEVIVEGVAVGHSIATGVVRHLENPDDADAFQDGEILVTRMTDPDWVPIMERAAAIVTDYGGRTSHAAIVARELGVPAIVGTNEATYRLKTGQTVTVSCAEGDRGMVYAGEVPFEREGISYENLPKTDTKIMMIVGSPQTTFRWWRVPCEGVGLARLEFIINRVIRAHPMALVHPEKVKDPWDLNTIEDLTRGYQDKKAYFVDKLAWAMASIAAAQWPHPVIVRMSDFKTNEYADLVGGKAFEPREANPMLGFRGASRYYSPRYREGFEMECQALKRARDELGLTNIRPMIPFCRTPTEADKVQEVMKSQGLERGKNGLEMFVMIEVPSNVVLARQFAERFDGFSIGSNDLTQLTLGIDRDSADLADIFDARDPAVSELVRQVIAVARETGTKIGICGQAPSDHPDFAEFLVECGIDTIAVNPDSLVTVREHVAQAEARRES